jgi:hypothetical protein
MTDHCETYLVKREAYLACERRGFARVDCG